MVRDCVKDVYKSLVIPEASFFVKNISNFLAAGARLGLARPRFGQTFWELMALPRPIYSCSTVATMYRIFGSYAKKYLRTASTRAKTQKNERSLWMGRSFDFSDRNIFLNKNAHSSQFMHVQFIIWYVPSAEWFWNGAITL